MFIRDPNIVQDLDQNPVLSQDLDHSQDLDQNPVLSQERDHSQDLDQNLVLSQERDHSQDLDQNYDLLQFPETITFSAVIIVIVFSHLRSQWLGIIHAIVLDVISVVVN